MEISEFTIDHYDKVIQLWQKCKGIGLSSADTKQSIALFLTRNPGMSFIARENTAIIGAVLCGHDGRRGYLHHLAVHPEYRKRGIGRQLMQKCCEMLCSEGIQKCHLFVLSSNSDGKQFWENAGWTFRTDINVMSINI